MKAKDRSVIQRVGNRGTERRLSRGDALIAYAIDRLLFRLGRSRHAKQFYLKGGILVANLVDTPHRFSRDIDLLQRRGPPDPKAVRQKFREIALAALDDGIVFDADGVRAEIAERVRDGYDGIKLSIRAQVGQTAVDIPIDIGFGDAVLPPAKKIALTPFLPDDPPANVYAYQVESVLAEKIETLIFKFPLIRHRLKDLLDVVTLAKIDPFSGASLAGSLAATLARRDRTTEDLARGAHILDEMRTEIKKWSADWALMLRDKRVTQPLELSDAMTLFDAFVRPLLDAAQTGKSSMRWNPGGPWDSHAAD